MTNTAVYPTTIAPVNGQATRFLFESTGAITITKVVEYRFIQLLDDGRAIFNLGFGDYDPTTGDILDDISSNNGDVYRVFATVLSTVVQFYNLHPAALIFVQGSDSQTTFEAACRLGCTRNCGTQCRQAGRRIAAYRGFINRNLETLTPDYVFYGRIADNREFELFVKGQEYLALLVYKRM